MFLALSVLFPEVVIFVLPLSLVCANWIRCFQLMVGKEQFVLLALALRPYHKQYLPGVSRTEVGVSHKKLLQCNTLTNHLFFDVLLESHSILGSTFLNPTTAAGVAFGSGVS